MTEQATGRQRRRRTGLMAAVALATVTASALAALKLGSPPPGYATWEGIGPDKWASVWLLRRHVDPDADIVFHAPKTPIEEGTPFDVPGAALAREGAVTSFEKLLEAWPTDDPAIAALAGIVNRIEVSGWQVKAYSATAQVETAYRDLQYRHGRERVPFGCYLAFFDRVHEVLSDPAADLEAMAPEQLLPAEGCALSAETASGSALVPELHVRAVLERIGKGEKVVFVDTREDDEFATGHIPGAVNLRLRDVDERSAAPLADADLVVPYCVKDFRGFEVGRALQKAGVTRVAILNPYGIRGWRQLGLPVTDGLQDGGAGARLKACAEEVDRCLAQ